MNILDTHLLALPYPFPQPMTDRCKSVCLWFYFPLFSVKVAADHMLIVPVQLLCLQPPRVSFFILRLYQYEYLL